MQPSSRLKELARKYRRRFFEFFGSDRYSRPGLQGLDKKLEKYLPQQGFFIEVGANDGFSQSNTYYLEKFKGWRGILIEAIPELYQECVQNRRRATVLNCALVAADYPDSTVEMTYAHLMSLVKGARPSPELDNIHLRKAQEFFGVNPYKIQVPAKTLASILDEMNVSKIDFFSLDVEGYELNVLKGLDLSRYRPEYILIEYLDQAAREEIETYLSDYYVHIAQLSKYDYLYHCR